MKTQISKISNRVAFTWECLVMLAKLHVIKLNYYKLFQTSGIIKIYIFRKYEWSIDKKGKQSLNAALINS